MWVLEIIRMTGSLLKVIKICVYDVQTSFDYVGALDNGIILYPNFSSLIRPL